LLAVACAKQPSDGAVVAANPSDTRRGSHAPDSDSSSAGSPPSAKLGRIVVRAGGVDRQRSVVTFPLALDVSGMLILSDASGEKVWLQRRADGTATFILPSLAAGKEAVFAIERADVSPAGGLGAVERGKALDLASDGRTVVRFQMQGELPPGVDAVYSRGGYLHPLYTPGGVPVTGDYPDDHKHHHGIWSAWTRTRFGDHAIDFWNMDDRQGKVDFRALEGAWHGPVFSSWRPRCATAVSRR
jgi:hypothetical protein